MREIKFRFYNTQEKRMMTQYELSIKKLYDMLFGNDKKYIVMQYTGIKDKNGVEIYEGDIFKMIEVRNEGLSEYVTDVIWEDCSFCVKSEDVGYYDTPLGAWAGDPNKTYPLFEISVIGNIYENPELLDGGSEE